MRAWVLAILIILIPRLKACMAGYGTFLFIGMVLIPPACLLWGYEGTNQLKAHGHTSAAGDGGVLASPTFTGNTASDSMSAPVGNFAAITSTGNITASSGTFTALLAGPVANFAAITSTGNITASSGTFTALLAGPVANFAAITSTGNVTASSGTFSGILSADTIQAATAFTSTNGITVSSFTATGTSQITSASSIGLIFNTTGNVGVTNNAIRLQRKGSDQYQIGLGPNSGRNALEIADSGASAVLMNIQNGSGYVGIGQSSATAQLDVVGVTGIRGSSITINGGGGLNFANGTRLTSRYSVGNSTAGNFGADSYTSSSFGRVNGSSLTYTGSGNSAATQTLLFTWSASLKNTANTNATAARCQIRCCDEDGTDMAIMSAFTVVSASSTAIGGSVVVTGRASGNHGYALSLANADNLGACTFDSGIFTVTQIGQ